MNPKVKIEAEDSNDEVEEKIKNWEMEKAEILKSKEDEQGQNRPAKKISEKKKEIKVCLKKVKLVQINLKQTPILKVNLDKVSMMHY